MDNPLRDQEIRNAPRPSGKLKRAHVLLAIVLLCGLLIRLPFALHDFHVGVDLTLLMQWVNIIQARGLGYAYTDARINYPPLSLYLLAAAGWIAPSLPNLPDGGALVGLVKAPALLADVLTAGLLAYAGWAHSPRLAILIAAAYVFNPAIWYVSAYWAQTDSIYTCLLVAAVIALDRDKLPLAWLACTLALATKLQSIALVPLLLALTVFVRRPRTSIFCLFVFLVTTLALILPWLATGQWQDIIRIYTHLPTETPRVVVSAYNFWYLVLRGHVQPVSSELHPLNLPITYQTAGILLFGLFALLVTAIGIARRLYYLAAAALALGMFMLLTQIHERYLFPALALVALAWIMVPRLWLLYLILTVTCFFNLITIAPFTDLLGTNLVAAEPTTITVMLLKRLAVLVAAVNVGALVWIALELLPPLRIHTRLRSHLPHDWAEKSERADA